MENKNLVILTGRTSIVGALCMILGAVCWGASGTDLWQALADEQIGQYLLQLPKAKSLLVLNTSFWIIGVLLLATALSLMADFTNSNYGLAPLVKVLSQSGASIAIVSFIMMLSLAIVNPTVDSATLVGWIGARVDDIATMCIVGFCPLVLAIDGKNDWLPGWLSVWGYLSGISGLLGVISLFTGIVALGFIIIPVGIGWMIASGIVLVKKAKMIGI